MATFDPLSKLKRIFLFILVGASTLTIVTNYLNFESNVHDELETSVTSHVKCPVLCNSMNTERTNVLNVHTTSESEAIQDPPWPNCTNSTIENEIWEGIVRKTYTILTNFVSANYVTSCDDSLITLTTHGDYRYLDNLVPVVERWQGPISIALYVPYKDLNPTLHRIAYMRECTSPLIKNWVSFHLFAERRYFNRHNEVEKWADEWKTLNQSMFCSRVPEFNDTAITSRKVQMLFYPVNIARNIARQAATTRYILASDIELYPSINFIPKFFDMLQRHSEYFKKRRNPFVFVLPIFEIEEGYDLPDTKKQLIELIEGNFSVVFHKYVCPECHKVPKYEKWLIGDKENGGSDELNIFYTAKRKRSYTNWEPIYVSTNDVPLYDERLTWEGLRDKMTQSYTMCLLNYDFMILDNAFLTHKPGIKHTGHNMKKPPNPIKRQTRFLNRIYRQITEKYGKRRGCR